MSTTPTAHQLAVIEGTDRHLLVAAGAGSGKTATVINRLLYLLGVPIGGRTIATPVTLERLAAITFTIPAAAELKRKLRERLREAGRTDLAWRADTARIGTIHSFCGEVLQEFALHQDASPSISVLQEGDTRALVGESARDALVAAVEAGHPGITDLLSRRGQKDVDEALLQLLNQGDRLRQLAAVGNQHPDETALIAVAVAALDLLEQRLRDGGTVDFDRMLTWTRDLLTSDDYARRTLQRRIHTLIIDEFQDVDPVQWEMARLLGEVGSGRTDTTRLLLVGDPKQSVYRFRGADVATWRAVERIFADGHGTVVPLNENFRSTAPILDFVAATAGRLLDTPLNETGVRQDYEINFARLEVGQPERQSEGPNVELIAVPPLDGGVDQIRALEAEAIARRAVALHADGVGWREMALLFPTWSSSGLYQDTLRRHGVPTYLRRDEGFYERREIMDQIVALQAVRDPTDDLALTGFLRSPFVGVRDETLLAIALAGAGPYWPRLRQVECAERELLHHGVALLERASALRDRVPHDVLLAGLLEESGYWAHLALLGPERQQGIANLRKFLALARDHAEGSLGDLLRSIAAERDREDRVGDARLHGEEDDVVTLTTIHSAKGLQWEAVFWCDLVRGPSNKIPKILVGRGQVALKDPEVKTQSDHWEALAGELKNEESAERARLAYVASTRAKKYLIVSPLGGEKPVHMAKFVGEQLKLGEATDVALTYPKHGGGEWSVTVTMADPAWLPANDAAPGLVPIGSDALDTLPQPLVPISVPAGAPLHSASEALVLARCERKHWFRHVLGFTEPAQARGGPSFGAATTRGQIVHEVLERHQVGQDLELLIEAAIREEDPTAPGPDSVDGKAYRLELRQVIESVTSDAAYREVADLPGARRELRFVYLTGPGEGWQGTLDLAARNDQGQVLLDVKTGKVSEADLERRTEHYRPQQEVYTLAARAIAGERVAEFRFHFAESGTQVRHVYMEDELVPMAERLAEQVVRMESGAPELTRHPEECERCGFKTVGWCPGV